MEWKADSDGRVLYFGKFPSFYVSERNGQACCKTWITEEAEVWAPTVDECCDKVVEQLSAFLNEHVSKILEELQYDNHDQLKLENIHVGWQGNEVLSPWFVAEVLKCSEGWIAYVSTGEVCTAEYFPKKKDAKKAVPGILLELLKAEYKDETDLHLESL